MKTKNRVREFLEDIGYGLGYNEKLLPDFKDLAIIEKYNIPVWEYMGYRNREDFHAFQMYKAVCSRRQGRVPTFSKPNLNDFCSDDFCFESYLEKNASL